MQTTDQASSSATRVASDAHSAYAPLHDSAATSDSRPSAGARLIRKLMSAFGNPRVQFVLWNGERVSPPGVVPVVSIHLHDRATLLRLCADPDLQFGELYSAGRIEVEGDLEQFITDIYRGKPI